MFLRLKKTSMETRARSPMFRRPWRNVSGRMTRQHRLHFLVKMSITITCIFVTRSWESDFCLCFFLDNCDRSWPHLGQTVTVVLKDLGHLPGTSNVSAVSCLDTISRTDVSGSSQESNMYSAVLVMYRWVKPQSTRCVSQSFS